jgi:hypothetical protein
MLTTILALTLTAIFSYCLVESGFALAGENTPARTVVALAAVATGFILPWAIVTGLVGLVAVEAE